MSLQLLHILDMSARWILAPIVTDWCNFSDIYALNIVNCSLKGHIPEVIDVIYFLLSVNQHWPQQGWYSRFHKNVKLICLKETEATSRLSTIKRAWMKFNWMRWVAPDDIESCWADEMDSLWQLKIMSFTQSAREVIQLLFQLLPWWLQGINQGQTLQTGTAPLSSCGM